MAGFEAPCTESKLEQLRLCGVAQYNLSDLEEKEETGKNQEDSNGYIMRQLGTSVASFSLVLEVRLPSNRALKS